jgi:hypothetical protein
MFVIEFYYMVVSSSINNPTLVTLTKHGQWSNKRTTTALHVRDTEYTKGAAYWTQGAGKDAQNKAPLLQEHAASSNKEGDVINYRKESQVKSLGQQHQGVTDEHGTSTMDSKPPAEIPRVAVRLLPFWAEWPAMWFAQAEAQFTFASISSEKTKFFHVISQLDHRYALKVEDIITFPPERDPYTMLVRRVSSREQHTHQLLTLEEMDDCRTS